MTGADVWDAGTSVDYRASMELDDEVWIDYNALLAAAHSAATDPGTRGRVATALSQYGHPNLRLAGRSTDREHLLRIYRRRMRSAGLSGQLPAGTQELVQRLEVEAEAESEIALFTLESDTEVVYIFAHRDLKSLVGCLAGERSQLNDPS